MRVNWTSIEALRIFEAGESSGSAIVWIGVEFGALSFKEGSVVALKCRTFIDSHGIRDYHIEIRESRVMRQGGNRFVDSVPVSDPTFAARDPYTATLGIPISAKNKPCAEGTGSLYFSAGGDDKDNNKEYERKNNDKAREDVVVLGISGFNEKIAAIDYEIRGQEYAITDAEERIKSVKNMEDTKLVRERGKAGQDLQEVEEGLKELRALRHEIATQWDAKERRVFG